MAGGLLSKMAFVRGLRFRFTVAIAIFVSALLLAVGFFFRQRLETVLDTQVRKLLDEEWAATKAYLIIHRREPEWRYDPEDEEETLIVKQLQRVYLCADSEGKVLDVSPAFEDLGIFTPEQIKAALATNQPYWDERISDFDGDPYVIRGGPFVDDDNHRYFVAIGTSAAESRRVLLEFTRTYFTILPFMILAAILTGWFLANRAISPVHELAEAAGRISGRNLSLRIPPRNSGDEIDNLIQTFNSMVERLENSFEMTRRFSIDVSHELRTPLTVIRGQLEVALFTASTAEQYRDAIIDALEDVEKLGQTVRAMLLLSQAESGQLALQKSVIDLAPVVADIVDQFQIPAEGEQITLSGEIEGPCWVEVDRIQIERMISNLLSNAVKYTPAGGTVTARCRTAGAGVVFEVDDTGVGIPYEALPHIFDRFYRVPGQKEKQGLGLGLSFVAWIAKAHGGSVEADSAVGRGTKFTVHLPDAPAPQPASTAAGVEAAEQPRELS
jgi:heavy metal sensor kinase